jgi:hypothetical protein
MEGFTKQAVEMGSVAMIYSYILGFIKIGSSIQKLIRKYTYTDTTTGCRSHKPTLGKSAENRHT